MSFNTSPNPRKIISKELSSDDKISLKKSSKKSQSKMFNKIFDAMNNSLKSNKHSTKENVDHLTDTSTNSKLSKNNQILRKLDWDSLINNAKSKDSKDNLLELKNKITSSNFGADKQELDSVLNTFNFNLSETNYPNSNVNNSSTLEVMKVEKLVEQANASLKPFPSSIDLEIPLNNDIEKNKGNDDTLDKLFNEIKIAKTESSQIQMANQSSNTDSSWVVTDVKTEKMKLSDWVEMFKNDIEKLNSFRVENQNKVSLTLKKNSELIKVTVEKSNGTIFINASSTEESKENLEFILQEISIEMKEKEIEVVVIIDEESLDDDKENENEKEEQDNSFDDDSEGDSEEDGSNRRSK